MVDFRRDLRSQPSYSGDKDVSMRSSMLLCCPLEVCGGLEDAFLHYCSPEACKPSCRWVLSEGLKAAGGLIIARQGRKGKDEVKKDQDGQADK